MARFSPTPARFGRRRFLVGTAAAGLLAACGGNDSNDVEAGVDDSGPDPTSGGSSELSVARFYGPYYLPGETARVPIGLADNDGLLPAAVAPTTVGIVVRDATGAEIASGIEAPLYSEGLPRPYYAFEFVPPAEGYYDVSVDTGDGTVLTQVAVAPADDPAASAIVGPGDPMPSLVTPTVADPAGVDPVCTRRPACPLHDRTVADMLTAGEPFALLVATPAFCQTAICGPVLDLFLGALDDRGLPAIHAEVFRDPANNQVPPALEDYAPVVGDLGLVFEPVLYTVGADGMVIGRLDYVFGTVEIAELLDAAVV